MTLGLEIVTLLFVLILFISGTMRKSLRDDFVNSAMALVRSGVKIMNQRNSRSTQQLRLYTLSDLALSNEFSTERVAEWLVNHRKLRYQDFQRLFYVDIETGMAYSDEGDVFSVKNTEYFTRIKEGNLSQYISNPVGTSAADAVFYVCKSINKNKKMMGFFCAEINHATLAKALVDIKIDGEGVTLLLTEDGTTAIHPVEEMQMKANFVKDDYGFKGGSEIAKEMVARKEGFGWLSGNGTSLLAVYTPVEGTPWSLAFAIPASEVFATAKTIEKSMVVCALVIALILIATAYVSVYWQLRPLKKVVKNINEIASGNADLRHRIRVKSDDEVGAVTSGFNNFIEKLQNIMKDIKSSRVDIDSAEERLKQGLETAMDSISVITKDIQAVDETLETQTKYVNGTARSVGKIAQNIAQLEQLVDEQGMNADSAGTAIGDMLDSINAVNDSVASLSESFDSLENLSNAGIEKQSEMNTAIGEIESQSRMLLEANSIIANIAGQTNLLSMNAAIEAAHAGEAGQGFAVVADEIRKLSENSSRQSRSIGHQLAAIKDSIARVVQASEETSLTFGSVNEKIKATDSLVKQIHSAMEEQKSGSVQIGDALREMNHSTSEVKNASREMADGNEAILQEVMHLKTSNDAMNESVRNMQNSTNVMSDTSENLKNIVGGMRNAITKIGSQIDNFEV